MSSELTTARPPAAVIVSTTSWAGVRSPPSPLSEPPTSLTTTLAPSLARTSASSRPIPRPAPVTIATLSSSKPMDSSLDVTPWRLAAQPAGCGLSDEAPRRAALPIGPWPGKVDAAGRTGSPAVEALADHGLDQLGRPAVGRLDPVLGHQRDDLDRRTEVRAALPGVLADDAEDRAATVHHRHHPADDLAVHRRRVETPLPGDHEVRPVEALFEADDRRHQLEPGHQPAAERGQPTGQPAGGAAAGEPGHVDAVVPPVTRRQLDQPVGQLHHLVGARPLLGPEHPGGILEPGGHVARHHQLGAPEVLGPPDDL